jgi:hypothetical protein
MTEIMSFNLFLDGVLISYKTLRLSLVLSELREKNIEYIFSK